VREVQGAFFTHMEARQFAGEGTARVPLKLRHLTEFRPAGVTVPVPVGTGGSDGAAVVVVTSAPELPPPPVRNWMTIAQARDAGMLPRRWSTNGAFRTAKYRAAREGIPVPEVRGVRGSEALYDATELADFLDAITARK